MEKLRSERLVRPKGATENDKGADSVVCEKGTKPSFHSISLVAQLVENPLQCET